MSCRVIGRQIEKAFLHFVIDDLKTKNVKFVTGKYFKTKKNIIVKDFYMDLNFKKKGNLWQWDTGIKLDYPKFISIEKQ